MPVHLSNCSDIAGGTIPLRYDSLPPGWSLDSVSYVGGRLEDASLRSLFDTTVVDEINRTVLVEWVGSGCLAPGSGTLFSLWLSAATCVLGLVDTLPYSACIDTTTLVDGGGNKSLALAACTNPPERYPSFIGECANLHGYVYADVDTNCEPDIFDVVRVVNVAFRNEPWDFPFILADLLKDSVINVFDVVLAVNCAFRNNCPSCDLRDTGASLAKPISRSAVADLTVTNTEDGGWEMAVAVESPTAWSAAQFEWVFGKRPENISVEVGEIAAGLATYWHVEDQRMTVGLIDIQGESQVEAGRGAVVYLSGTGDFPGITLTSGLLATEKAEPIVIALVGLSAAESSLPKSFGLESNYPNPFNAGTVITYSLAESGFATLKVFDVLGRCIVTLVDGFHSAGQHRTPWDGADAAGQPAASGMYFYRLTAGDVSETKKMVLLR